MTPHRGTTMANEVNQKQLYRECGAILESISQLNESAQFYEKGQQFERAVAVYIKVS